MNKPNTLIKREPSGDMHGRSLHFNGPLKGLVFSLAGLIACFSWPLYNLVRFSVGNELYSHIVLIPFISAYLIWLKRSSFVSRSDPNLPLARLLLAGGIAALAGYWLAVVFGTRLAPDNALALTISSFVLSFAGICGLYLGRQTFRTLAFPLGFLVFMIPMPTFFVTEIESFLQNGSASVASAFYTLSGTPVFRQDMLFQLPGILLEIAPECSGIHSTLALFITSVLAGYFFLRSPVSRAVLAMAVIPLALLRNGFRVFTIGELCVHISPDMINSYIHRHGGPVFFVLSLIPFFALLFVLIRIERSRQHQVPPA